MSDMIYGIIGVIVGAVLILIIRRAKGADRGTTDKGPHTAGTVPGTEPRSVTAGETSTAVSFTSGFSHPALVERDRSPRFRIRYRPRLGSWAIYKWSPEYDRYYGYGITYPTSGRWVLQTRVPTWEDAINLITPHPADERGSSSSEPS